MTPFDLMKQDIQIHRHSYQLYRFQHAAIIPSYCQVQDHTHVEITGFPENSIVYYIQRIHYLDDKPLIVNHNYFLKEAVPGLTKAIAEQSIYEYLEQTLHMTIVNSKRIMTVEKVTEIDEKYLKLNTNDYNCVAVVSSQTYNSDGIMFEYTQSRHRPDHFRFYDNAVRK